MIGKGNLRQRAISDYEFVKKKSKAQFVVQLHSGRLSINVSVIGVMHPFVKFIFGNESCRSSNSVIGGQAPKWDQYFSFTFDMTRELELIVFDKSIFFGDIEIGRCSILLADVAQGRQTEWWEILSPSGQLAGSIFLSFEFPQSETMHVSKNSWDLKMHHHIESSPVIRVKGKNFTQGSKLTPDIKLANSLTTTLVTEQVEMENCEHGRDKGIIGESIEIEDYESTRSALIEKHERCKNQEKVFLNDLHRTREENNLVRNERTDVKKSNEILQIKEEEILKEKEVIKKERGDIEEEKEIVKKQLEALNLEYMKLKKEKLRIRAQRSIQEKRKKRMERMKIARGFEAHGGNIKCEN